MIGFACNDEVVQDVPPEVCVSEKQWIGGKRGSPEMFPGRDCVGCHLDNDGPELMVGGTIYPYVQIAADEAQAQAFKTDLQTGEDCFGQEGVKVKITGSDEQTFEAVTNRAGNFYIEGKATDLVKPFKVELEFEDEATGYKTSASMSQRGRYGGCARCHVPGAQATGPELAETDEEVLAGAWSYVGLPGYMNLTELFGPAAQQ